MRIGKNHPFPGQHIDGWGVDRPAACISDAVETLIVTDDDHNIRFLTGQTGSEQDT
jgi:hypothetical protein